MRLRLHATWLDSAIASTFCFYNYNDGPVALMQYNDVVREMVNADAFKKYATIDSGTVEMLAKLQSLTREDLFPGGYQDADMAGCCLAGLWLLHNYLHEGHEICQDIKTPEGSFWHAIMHRSEGDYSNAKYWYRMARTDHLHQAISDSAGEPYSPNKLVDRVASEGVASVRQLVTAEWEALFNHCYQNAVSMA